MTAQTEVTWSKPFATVGPIDVVEVDLTAGAQREAAAAAWLDTSDRERWKRIRGAGARREFALCRAALRCHLGQRLDCGNERLTFGALRYGKPFVIVNGRRVPYGFNVSHGGGHALIAFATGVSIGVDVEARSPRRDLDGMAARFCGSNERAALATVEGQEKTNLFYRLWTLKEALVKALGSGFACDPTAFEVPPEVLHGARSGTIRLRQGRSMSWRVTDLGRTRFSAAVAYELGSGCGPLAPPSSTPVVAGECSTGRAAQLEGGPGA